MPGAATAAPPQPVDQTPFTVEGICAFPVQIQLRGKAKQIDLPGGRMIITAPGQRVTLTNLAAPSRQVTLNVTGSFQRTVAADGSVLTVSRGRSLLFDPVAGFVLAIGHFSFRFDASGNLVQPLSGKGQLLDACARIA
ncbi:MAG: hypothetical protein LC777_06130 [Actinobacteria bacterium]|nr:hypothetical protein [Actinomycetota bacterium]